MPNHVHLLLTPCEEWPLGRLVQTIKSFTSKRIHETLGGSGRLWQPDYFDRVIRDERHLLKVSQYIEWNPVKAKFVTDPSGYPFSSANLRNQSRIND
jgi:REP element-mobilizing transposase RayT